MVPVPASTATISMSPYGAITLALEPWGDRASIPAALRAEGFEPRDPQAMALVNVAYHVTFAIMPQSME